MAGNGVLDLSPFVELGGVKIKNAVAGSSFVGNWVHDNQGVGVWWDIDDVDSEIRGNLVEHNDLGIEYEISFGRAVISDNVILDNGLDHDWGLPYGSGVFVSNSSGVEVRGNVIDGAAYGIVVYGQDRGSSDRLGRVGSCAT